MIFRHLHLYLLYISNRFYNPRGPGSLVSIPNIQLPDKTDRFGCPSFLKAILPAVKASELQVVSQSSKTCSVIRQLKSHVLSLRYFLLLSSLHSSPVQSVKMNPVSAVLENNGLRGVLGNILSYLDLDSVKRAALVSR